MLIRKKKILVFTDWYEPGFRAGGPIRSCVNFAENMKDAYEIFVFTTDCDLGAAEPYLDVECDKWIKSNGINVLYASSTYLSFKNIKIHIKCIDPDYMYCNSMYSHYFSIYPLLIMWLRLTNSALVLAPRGMLKKTALQFKTTKKRIFLLCFKLLGIHKKIIFHATDETEKTDIKKIFGENVECKQILNFPSAQKPLIDYIEKQKQTLKIIFIGRIHPIKNLLLLLNHIKLLKSVVVFTIVGAIEDKDYWQECRQLIQLLPSNIQVIFKESVPNDAIKNLITDHHIFASPTEGENFGHAIFEALSVGRPVLISDQTPWRNLEQNTAGWDLPLNNSKEFIRVLNMVADMDNEIYQLWSKGAWQLAHDFITKSDLKNQYLKLFS